MKVIGITGGVGSGKSTILSYIGSAYGARVIQADQVGHLMMHPGQKCYYQIVEAFGSSILNGDSTINREKLSRIVFSEPEKLEKLNGIIHPGVKEYIVREIHREESYGCIPLIVVEAALLIEDHYHAICDELWYIYASEAVRRKRLIRSRNYTDEKIDGILSNQLSDEEYRTHCEVVIDNSGEQQETRSQVDVQMDRLHVPKRGRTQ